VYSGGSYASSNDPRVHFGLGDVAKVDAVEIHWPDGTVEKVQLPGIDRIVTLEEGKGIADKGKGVTGHAPAAKGK
jgi:enediyne biosynthesis protein E4